MSELRYIDTIWLLTSRHRSAQLVLTSAGYRLLLFDDATQVRMEVVHSRLEAAICADQWIAQPQRVSDWRDTALEAGALSVEVTR